MLISIDEQNQGARADAFLAAHLNLSRAAAKQRLSAATINGATCKASQMLRAGDVLQVPDAEIETATLAEPGETALPPILYEDEYLLVINKPRDLIVHEGAGAPQLTLVELLQAHGRELSNVGPSGRAGIVHRLDKGTTGAMVVCKDDATHEQLARDFAQRKVRKTYRALVCGVPKLAAGGRGRIEAPIARHRVQRKKMAVSPEGRPAVTEYEIVRSWSKMALLDIDLLTGRTHQIRVHLGYLGHPVAGDAKYGGLKRALEIAPDEATKNALQVLAGQALHAARLEFTHPVTQQTVRCDAPLPPNFQAVVDALENAEKSDD